VNWCGPFVRNQQPAKRVAGPLRVNHVIAGTDQNRPLSVVSPIASLAVKCSERRFVPFATNALQQTAFLFDHLVGAGKQPGRHVNA